MLRYALISLTLALGGCSINTLPNDPKNVAAFQSAEKIDMFTLADKATLAAFEADADAVYHLGEGDKITLQVWNRPELSGKHTIGPDGIITVPLIGSMRLNTMTREEASNNIGTSLKRYYNTPVVNLGIDEYQANRITVLGRVLTPGVLQFSNPPVLLDVLARAGSLPVLDKQATLTRCAIFRGREKIIWVDLKRLLNRSDLAYNIRLKPNDLIYIPDSFDTLVYVMGAVARPGAYRLTPDMSLLDAVAQAGGPNEDANPGEVSIHRTGRQAVERFSMKELLTGERKVNYSLEEGDVIYVPKRGLAEAGYVMRQLLPGLSFMTFGISANTSSGK